MSPDEGVSEPLTPSEGPPQGIAPLRLPPDSAALELVDARDRGLVLVNTEWRQVQLGVTGVRALLDWLASCQAIPTGAEPELWTATGISKETGYARRTVYQWIDRDDFPLPFATPVGGAACWEASRVRAWIESRQRRGEVGRLPKQIP